MMIVAGEASGDMRAAGLARAFAGADRLLLISGTRVGKRIPQHAELRGLLVAFGLEYGDSRLVAGGLNR